MTFVIPVQKSEISLNYIRINVDTMKVRLLQRSKVYIFIRYIFIRFSLYVVFKDFLLHRTVFTAVILFCIRHNTGNTGYLSCIFVKCTRFTILG